MRRTVLDAHGRLLKSLIWQPPEKSFPQKLAFSNSMLHRGVGLGVHDSTPQLFVGLKSGEREKSSGKRCSQGRRGVCFAASQQPHSGKAVSSSNKVNPAALASIRLGLAVAWYKVALSGGRVHYFLATLIVGERSG